MKSVAIVGASLAGLAAASGLRKAGFDGSIQIIEAEDSLPPDRPPLSKHVLAGEWPLERASQPAASMVETLEIDFRFGRLATSFDGERRVLTHRSADGEAGDGEAEESTVADGLVIASGARPRPLPAAWAALGGVHTIRTRFDTAALLADVAASTGRVLIVGAGVIGLEAASSLISIGRQVTVVETQPVPLSRILSPAIGERIASMHHAAGVDLRCGVGIDRFLGDRRFAGAVLTDGTHIDADVAIVGIGVIPNTEWLAASGSSGVELDATGGVVCDEFCVAGPSVVAAGDVASFVNGRYGERMRVEHWDHAIEMGGYAGTQLVTAGPTPYEPVPYFWTDQLGSKLQVAGRIHPDDEMVMLDGAVTDDRFVAAFRHGDRVGAVLSFNRPAPVIRWRMRMATPDGVAWSEAVGART